MSAEKIFGMATGIGSMPHSEPVKAIELVFRYFNRVPHWPQLPRRNSAEGFIAQYLVPLLKREIVIRNDGDSLSFASEHPKWEQRCLDFYEMLLGVGASPEDEFAFPPDSAAGFYALLDRPDQIPGEAVCLKGQISGPVTVGFQVLEPGGNPSFYSDTLRELMVKSLSGQAAWQARKLGSAGKPALLFIDDPGIYSFGTSGAVGLGRREIQDSLREIIEAIHLAGAAAGVHCCAGTDWSLLLELPLDFISFDAYDFFASMKVYFAELDSYLGRGGALAWGIVPTSEDILNEDTESLMGLLDKQIEELAKKNVSETALRRQMMITPACGTGVRTVTLAERTYRITAELAERLA